MTCELEMGRTWSYFAIFWIIFPYLEKLGLGSVSLTVAKRIILKSTWRFIFDLSFQIWALCFVDLEEHIVKNLTKLSNCFGATLQIRLSKHWNLETDVAGELSLALWQFYKHTSKSWIHWKLTCFQWKKHRWPCISKLGSKMFKNSRYWNSEDRYDCRCSGMVVGEKQQLANCAVGFPQCGKVVQIRIPKFRSIE